MVKIWKIVNGEKKVIEVTRSAYEGIFKKQGFEIFNSENPAHERRKVERNAPVVPADAPSTTDRNLGMEKCYIYAFDINDKKIIAALPCEGNIEAGTACTKTIDELKRNKLEHGTLRFSVARLCKARDTIGLRRVIEIGDLGYGHSFPPIDVPVEDFEAAASHTKNMLSKIQTLDDVPVEIQFMQFAEAILPKITVEVLPKPYVENHYHNYIAGFCWTGKIKNEKKEILLCCRLGDLSENELTYFKEKSEIEKCCKIEGGKIFFVRKFDHREPFDIRYSVNEAIQRFENFVKQWKTDNDAFFSTWRHLMESDQAVQQFIVGIAFLSGKSHRQVGQ